MHKYLFIIFILLLSLTINNCISLSTFQSAQTIEDGKFALTGGTVGFIEEGDAGIFPEIGFRYGMTNRADLGLKLVLPLLIVGDIKYELIQAPVTISFDFGFSVFPDDNYRAVALYPMLIAGTDKWYVGVKKTYARYTGTDIFWGTYEYDEVVWYPPVIVIGGVFGEKLRILPELNIYTPNDDGEIGIMPGLGIELYF